MNSTHYVNRELNGFRLFFGICCNSTEVAAARFFTWANEQAPVEVEIAFNVDSKTVWASVFNAIFDPSTILNRIINYYLLLFERKISYTGSPREFITIRVGYRNNEPFNVINNVSVFIIMFREFMNKVYSSHHADPIASRSSSCNEDNWKSFLTKMFFICDSNGTDFSSFSGPSHDFRL